MFLFRLLFRQSILFGGRRRLYFGSKHTSFTFLTAGIIGMTSTFSSDGMKILLVQSYLGPVFKFCDEAAEDRVTMVPVFGRVILDCQ